MSEKPQGQGEPRESIPSCPSTKDTKTNLSDQSLGSLNNLRRQKLQSQCEEISLSKLEEQGENSFSYSAGVNNSFHQQDLNIKKLEFQMANLKKNVRLGAEKTLKELKERILNLFSELNESWKMRIQFIIEDSFINIYQQLGPVAPVNRSFEKDFPIQNERILCYSQSQLKLNHDLIDKLMKRYENKCLEFSKLSSSYNSSLKIQRQEKESLWSQLSHSLNSFDKSQSFNVKMNDFLSSSIGQSVGHEDKLNMSSINESKALKLAKFEESYVSNVRQRQIQSDKSDEQIQVLQSILHNSHEADKPSVEYSHNHNYSQDSNLPQ